jgi:hypothetical protein
VGEKRALELVRAASDGAVLTLLTTPPDQRDPHLADAMYDAVAHTILTNAPDRVEHRVVTPAVALRATAPTLTVAGKTSVYDQLAAHSPYPLGLKLFLSHDPVLMTPHQVDALHPQPQLIDYQ